MDCPLPVEIVPFSTIDVPGYISCIVFFDSCNLNCTFCQNYQLLEKKEWKCIEVDTIIDKMKKNGFIEAISLSGGEPILKKNIGLFIERVKMLASKELGIDLFVNVDTNGTSIKPLERVLPHVDKVTIDVKASDRNCIEITRPSTPMQSYLSTVVDSMTVVLKAGKKLAIRITYSPSWLEERDLVEIGKKLSTSGIFSPINIQRFIKRNVRSISMNYTVPTNEDLEHASKILKKFGLDVTVSFR